MQSIKNNHLKLSFGRMSLRAISIILMIVFVMTSCDVYEETGASVYTVTGKISDEHGPLQGVSVRVEGTHISSTTDSQGQYSLTGVPGATVVLTAEYKGKILVPGFDVDTVFSNGNSVNMLYSTCDDYVLSGCDFKAVDRVTIPLIQGRGNISPLNGMKVENVIGVVTQVTFLQNHNNSQFETPDPEVGDSKRQVMSEDGFYMQLLPGCEIEALRADGDSATSDGIFVSTRNHEGAWGDTDWLPSCMIDGNFPQPGDVVCVTGTVREYIKPDRFDDTKGFRSRTQIAATSVEIDYEAVPEGKITLEDRYLVTMTYDESVEKSDLFRVVPFDGIGFESATQASDVFESCEGMLVKINDPIVTGATYYNMTPVLADGGKKAGKSANGGYPDQFNRRWMAPVVAENDFNTEIIYTYYDSWTDANVYNYQAALPQIGTVLMDDDYNKVFRGVMDYNDNGLYMIYPFRTYNLRNTDTELPDKYFPYSEMDYSSVDFPMHDYFRFGFNDEADEKSLYRKTGGIPKEYVYDNMFDAQADYKEWIRPSEKGDYNDDFSVPESWVTDNRDDYMNVAVFNLENYIQEGAPYGKANDIANIIAKNLRFPDLIIFVEMGDHDNSSTTIIDRNSLFSQNNITGVVAARLNYEYLIELLADHSEGGVQYDYRQIDPVEYTQAGSPGNNIRVGFMFRVDRVEAVDRGRTTIHMELPGSDYRIPDNLKDEHDPVDKTLSDYKNVPPMDPEPVLTLDTKKILAETATSVFKDANGTVSLTQSPGFVQDGRFYNSRLPLACHFRFIPNSETSVDFIGIALHLYSKGRDDSLYGCYQPPVLSSEMRRAGQSIAVHEFIETILAENRDAKIIVGGDVNDFGFTDPIKKLTGENIPGAQILHSMSAEYMPENERFSYTFNGNLQQLDHIFVSPALYAMQNNTAGVRNENDDSWKDYVFVPHVNSMFSRDRHIQVSDHDPITARIRMTTEK